MASNRRPAFRIKLSNKRLRGVASELRIGELVTVVVKKKIDGQRYLVVLRGHELRAGYDGHLNPEDVVSAVVHSLTPNVVLKLMHVEDNKDEAERYFRELIRRSIDDVSLRPLQSELIKRFAALCNEYQSLFNKRRHIEIVASIREAIMRHVLQPDSYKLDMFLNSAELTFLASIATCQQMLCDTFRELFLESKGKSESVFFKLKKQIEIMRMHEQLIRFINELNISRKDKGYKQYTFRYSDVLGAAEVRFGQENERIAYETRLCYSHYGFIAGSYDLAQRHVVVTECVFDASQEGNSFIDMLHAWLDNMNRTLEYSVQPGVGNRRWEDFFKTTNVDISLPQNFTLVI